MTNSDPETATEIELLEKAQDGSDKAMHQLIQSYEGPLFGFLLNRLRNPSDAEDCAQDVFLKMIAALPKYENRGQFRAWLYTIARNESLNFLKKRGKREETISREPVSSDQTDLATGSITLDQKERILAIRECVEDLPEKENDVLQLRLSDDITFREISEVLGRPLNTVLGQMRKASARLELCLQGKGIN